MQQRTDLPTSLSTSAQHVQASAIKNEQKAQDTHPNTKTKNKDYFSEISGFWPLGFAQSTFNVLYQAGSSVKGFFIKKWSEDAYKLYVDPNTFILDEMYKRAKANNNVAWIDTAPEGLSNLTLGYFPRRLYMIVGTKANISTVNAEGEKKKEEPRSKYQVVVKKAKEWMSPPDQYARFFFTHAIKALKKKTLVNRTGHEALAEKNLIRKHLVGDDSITFAHEVSRNLFRHIMTHWDPNISFQDYITYLGTNVIAQCVVGFPEVKMSHIPDIRKAGKTLALPFDATPTKLKEAGTIVHRLNQEIFDEAQELIRTPTKVAADYFKQRGFSLDDPETISKKLINEEVDRHLIVADGNLSFTMMSGLVLLNLYSDVKEQLRAEVLKFKQAKGISETTPLNATQLKELRYLDCIYFEILRYIASVPVTPRMTSEPTTLNIQGTDKQVYQLHVPQYSYLFAGLRPAHLDPVIWPNPREFNPSRFENDSKNELRNQVNAFSEGPRGCPARLGFTESSVKTILVDSLDWIINLTKEPLQIPNAKINPFVHVPTYTMDAFWPEEYYAVVRPDPNTKNQNLGMGERNDQKDHANEEASAETGLRCRA